MTQVKEIQKEFPLLSTFLSKGNHKKTRGFLRNWLHYNSKVNFSHDNL